MPDPVAGLVAPKSDQPDFIRVVERTDDFHALEPVGGVDFVRPVAKRFLDLGGHAVADGEFTDDRKACRRRGQAGLTMRRCDAGL